MKMANLKKIINCRICLRDDIIESKKCLSLFETYNGCSICDKVNSITNIDIKQNDKFPNTICPDCLLQLEIAIEFKTKCEASNEILRNNFLSLSVIDQQLKDTEECENYPVKTELSEPELGEDQNDHFREYCSAGESEQVEEEEKEYLLKKPIQKRSSIELICDDCGGSFRSKCKLRVHWKKVHLHEKLICQVCKRNFKSYRAFNLHQKSSSKSCIAASKVRVEGLGKTRVFHCKDCNYKSKRIKDIDMHLSIHTGDRRFQCKDCLKCFTQHSSLQSHREGCHKDYRIDTTCHLCGKHLQGRTNYYRHMRSHSEESVHCKVCNKILKNKRYLSLHMLRHSGVKTYSCEICAASFFTCAEVYNHRKKVHMKSRSIKCDQCEYKMFSKAALKKHRLKHTGTNVVCLVCGQFSECAEKLLLHQKCHFERNIQCPQCEKMFHNKRALNSHVVKNHRCTMLVEKRFDKPNETKLNATKIKKESSTAENDDVVILLSPPAVILK